MQKDRCVLGLENESIAIILNVGDFQSTRDNIPVIFDKWFRLRVRRPCRLVTSSAHCNIGRSIEVRGQLHAVATLVSENISGCLLDRSLGGPLKGVLFLWRSSPTGA